MTPTRPRRPPGKNKCHDKSSLFSLLCGIFPHNPPLSSSISPIPICATNRMRKYLDGGAAMRSGGLHQELNQHHKHSGCCPNSWSGRRLRSSYSIGRSSRHCPRVERPTTMMVTLSMLLLSLFANDSAAFRNQPPLPLLGRASQVATRNCECHVFIFCLLSLQIAKL